MIYLLYGEQIEKAREKAYELVEQLLKKKPNASFYKIDADNFTKDSLKEFQESQGLFENKYIVLLNEILKEKETQEIILEELDALKESPHIFIFVESKLVKAIVGKIEKRAEKIQEFSGPEKKEKKDEFNVFALTDAFGRRDRKGLWVLYTQTRIKNIAPEEIHGLLFWQLKNMMIVDSLDGATGEETGLSPFVARKAKEFARNFSREELHALSSKLVSLYHNARRSGPELGVALEQFILEM